MSRPAFPPSLTYLDNRRLGCLLRRRGGCVRLLLLCAAYEGAARVPGRECLWALTHGLEAREHGRQLCVRSRRSRSRPASPREREGGRRRRRRPRGLGLGGGGGQERGDEGRGNREEREDFQDKSLIEIFLAQPVSHAAPKKPRLGASDLRARPNATTALGVGRGNPELASPSKGSDSIR